MRLRPVLGDPGTDRIISNLIKLSCLIFLMRRCGASTER